MHCLCFVVRLLHLGNCAQRECMSRRHPQLTSTDCIHTLVCCRCTHRHPLACKAAPPSLPRPMHAYVRAAQNIQRNFPSEVRHGKAIVVWVCRVIPSHCAPSLCHRDIVFLCLCQHCKAVDAVFAEPVHPSRRRLLQPCTGHGVLALGKLGPRGSLRITAPSNIVSRCDFKVEPQQRPGRHM